MMIKQHKTHIIMNKLSYFFFLAFAFSFASCDLVETISTSTSNTYYLWLSADADTYVECFVGPGGGCAGGDINHAGSQQLVSAAVGGTRKRIYVNFPKPSFPQGTVIEEAYFELYHSGKNEDGKSDNISLNVTRVPITWTASEVTYNDQPLEPGNFGEFYLKLESQAWSGSDNIAYAMSQAYLESQPFEGFAVDIPRPEPGYEKGFYSSNHPSNSLGDPGFAPRMLMKVTLPEGAVVSDIQLRDFNSDSAGSQIFSFLFRNGNQWPSDWEIARD